jgi:hypothetical protein
MPTPPATPEFNDKQDALALFLFNMNNGPCETLRDVFTHPDYGPDYRDNYLTDAGEILRIYPHLLGLDTRQKMGLDK